MELREIDNQSLVTRLKDLVAQERDATIEIISHIQEVDRRRLYLELGYTSLFSYLSECLGYTPAAAQRRIDTARLLNAIPELKNDLAEGSINLMQASMVAQGVRQKKKENTPVTVEGQRALLSQIKGLTVESTQKLLAQSLDLPIVSGERVRIQQDESIRIELTFSKSDFEKLKRVKEVISHINPNPSWADLLQFLADDFLNRKDPSKLKTLPTSRVEAAPSQKKAPVSRRPPIPAKIRRFVFRRDQSCRWKNPRTQKVCGSKFQLEVDHIYPIRYGGGNEPENLQLLCSIHNKYKYRKEVAT